MELKPSDVLTLQNVGRALGRASFKELDTEEVLALALTIKNISELASRLEDYFKAAQKSASKKPEPKPVKKKARKKRGTRNK